MKENNIYMSKRMRNLKKHYRSVEKQIREFNIDLSDESWYNLYHTHLDMYGITNNSQKHRKKHIQYYIDLLEKIERLTIQSKRDFQTWIFLDWKEGMYDAIYFHTENPHSDFPYSLDSINWNTEIPHTFSSLFDLSKYIFGKIENQNGCLYIIQKKGLGKAI